METRRFGKTGYMSTVVIFGAALSEYCANCSMNMEKVEQLRTTRDYEELDLLIVQHLLGG